MKKFCKTPASTLTPTQSRTEGFQDEPEHINQLSGKVKNFRNLLLNSETLPIRDIFSKVLSKDFNGNFSEEEDDKDKEKMNKMRKVFSFGESKSASNSVIDRLYNEDLIREKSKKIYFGTGEFDFEKTLRFGNKSSSPLESQTKLSGASSAKKSKVKNSYSQNNVQNLNKKDLKDDSKKDFFLNYVVAVNGHLVNEIINFANWFGDESQISKYLNSSRSKKNKFYREVKLGDFKDDEIEMKITKQNVLVISAIQKYRNGQRKPILKFKERVNLLQTDVESLMALRLSNKRILFIDSLSLSKKQITLEKEFQDIFAINSHSEI